jgi:hypothetical protein
MENNTATAGLVAQTDAAENTQKECRFQFLPGSGPGLLVTLDSSGNWTGRSPYKRALNEVVAEGHVNNIGELVEAIQGHSDW